MGEKFRKLELIEVPMSELEQSALDEILAGYYCESYYVDGGKEYCTDLKEKDPCDHCKIFTCLTNKKE